MVPGAILWVRAEVLQFRVILPSRLALWALRVPSGPITASLLEPAVIADLAATSEGWPESLLKAATVVEDREVDPWRRGLAAERLHAAHELLRQGRLSDVLFRRARLHPTPRIAAAAASLPLATMAQLTRSRWWLLAMTVACVELSAGWADLWKRNRVTPEALAAASLTEPVPGSLWIPEETVALGLAELSSADPDCLRRARRLIERTVEDPTSKAVAENRLRVAETAVDAAPAAGLPRAVVRRAASMAAVFGGALVLVGSVLR